MDIPVGVGAPHTRATRGRVASVAIALASLGSGCLTPLLHPLRATDGPIVEIASTLTVDAGRRGQCDDGATNCADVDEHHPSLDELAISLGYAHVFERTFGVM